MNDESFKLFDEKTSSESIEVCSEEVESWDELLIDTSFYEISASDFTLLSDYEFLADFLALLFGPADKSRFFLPELYCGLWSWSLISRLVTLGAVTERAVMLWLLDLLLILFTILGWFFVLRCFCNS